LCLDALKREQEAVYALERAAELNKDQALQLRRKIEIIRQRLAPSALDELS
jgi:hypothetical protein